MKIIIFGASGATGRHLVQQALEVGYEVTAFVRNPDKVEVEHPLLAIHQGDVMDAEAVQRAIAGQEAVLSTLGPTRPAVPKMMETAARNMVAAMEKHDIKRIVSTTGAGVRAPQDQPNLFDQVMKGLLTLFAAAVLLDSEANVNIIRGSDLDWTIVRFPRLVEGPHTGKYRVGYLGQNSGTQLSRADGADFILKELAKRNFIHQMPVVSY